MGTLEKRLGRVMHGEGNGNPFQYSRLENPMDGGAWWAIVHWIADADTTEHPAHITTSL